MVGFIHFRNEEAVRAIIGADQFTFHPSNLITYFAYFARMNALVFGSSGLIGSSLLAKLLEDRRFERVFAFVRNPEGPGNDRLTYIPFDFHDWEGIRSRFTSDSAAFCCIGTTRTKTPDYNEYRGIDYEIPVHIGRLCSENNISCYMVISSLGADKNSNNFYLKLKGEMEEAVTSLGLNRFYFLRPSLLLGQRKEKRPAEWMGKVLGRVISPLLVGTLRKYKPVHADTVVAAMLRLTFSERPSGVVESNEIIDLASHEQ